MRQQKSSEKTKKRKEAFVSVVLKKLISQIENNSKFKRDSQLPDIFETLFKMTLAEVREGVLV